MTDERQPSDRADGEQEQELHLDPETLRDLDATDEQTDLIKGGYSKQAAPGIACYKV